MPMEPRRLPEYVLLHWKRALGQKPTTDEDLEDDCVSTDGLTVHQQGSNTVSGECDGLDAHMLFSPQR